MYVCMHACMYVCMYIRMYVCMYAYNVKACLFLSVCYGALALFLFISADHSVWFMCTLTSITLIYTCKCSLCHYVGDVFWCVAGNAIH